MWFCFLSTSLPSECEVCENEVLLDQLRVPQCLERPWCLRTCTRAPASKRLNCAWLFPAPFPLACCVCHRDRLPHRLCGSKLCLLFKINLLFPVSLSGSGSPLISSVWPILSHSCDFQTWFTSTEAGPCQRGCKFIPVPHLGLTQSREVLTLLN